MNKKTILFPNLLILTYTLIMYHGALFSGHISKTVILLLCASILPAIYSLIKNMWAPIKIITALANLVLFGMFAYFFLGISYMLIKHGTANYLIFAAIFIIWLAVILTAVLKKRTVSVTFNVLLLLFAAAGYFMWDLMPLRASLNAAIFGSIAAISALNVYSILVSLIKRK